MKDDQKSLSYQNNQTTNEETMNQVNQTFDQMKQEVKDLLDENNKAVDLQS